MPTEDAVFGTHYPTDKKMNEANKAAGKGAYGAPASGPQAAAIDAYRASRGLVVGGAPAGNPQNAAINAYRASKGLPPLGAGPTTGVESGSPYIGNSLLACLIGTASPNLNNAKVRADLLANCNGNQVAANDIIDKWARSDPQWNQALQILADKSDAVLAWKKSGKGGVYGPPKFTEQNVIDALALINRSYRP